MVGTARRPARLLPALALGAACGSAPAAREGPAAADAPALAEVETVTVALPVALEAQLYVEHDAIVYARSAGIAQAVHVDIGAQVRAGQVLATLEDVDQRIALAEAEEAHANATKIVERMRQLGGRGVVAVADSEQAEFAFAQAALALRRARRELDLTRVLAPFAGAVTARTVRLGRLVAEGDSLFRVTAPAPLLVAVRVPERSAASIAIGGAAVVITHEGRTAGATVARLSPAIDAASGTRECVLRVAAGADLLPGTSVTVRLGAERRRVVAVPPDAISEDGYALVWEGGRSALRAVTTGATLPDGRLEVVSGLVPGERVVRAGQ
ncbi:MAG TPA: efflux RND transporter periplasmic adaptor subunit [Gemmatimonadales bacterium]